MFCKNCGAKLDDNVAFCPECGAKVKDSIADGVKAAADKAAEQAGQMAGEAKSAFQTVGSQVDSAVSDVEASMNHGMRLGAPLKTDRSLVAYILLSLVTCGLYGYYFIYTVARDVNTACADDDEETAGLGMYILLSLVTCGFYSLYWEYKLGNRIAKNGASYGIIIQEDGSSILLWRLLGALICGIGTFIGSHILIKNVNLICEAYNRKNGLQ